MTLTQFQKFRSASRILSEVFSIPHSVLFIHYSCESFYDRPEGTSPRITSIAVKFLGSGQTKSFSIHQEAELQGFANDEITAKYDDLEKLMLEKFASFASQFSSCKWIHWNMRDANYGFEAIAHRHRVLAGSPAEIPDTNRIDLAKKLYDLLGPKYVEHPRMENLLKLNDMVPRNFLSGKEEADAFEAGDYVRLHQSTLSKADALSNLAEVAAEGRLKSNNNYFASRGLTLATAGAIIKDHPLFSAVTVIGVLFALIANVIRIF